MNERINQLFGQALDQAVPETWTTLTPAQISLVKEKFAELIVRECADQCDLLLDHNINSDWARGTHACASHLRKYWGLT